MDAKFSPRLNDVLSYSREEALRLGHAAIGTEHLLLGIIREEECSAAIILKALSINLASLRKVIESAIRNNEGSDFANNDHIELKKQAARAVKLTYLELKVFKSKEIRTTHLLLSMLKDEDSVVTRALLQFNVDYEAVKNEFMMMLSDLNTESDNKTSPKAEYSESSPQDADDELFSKKQGNPKASKDKSSTPVLDNFGRDLTNMASNDRLDPIVGREKEIERVSQILPKKKE